MVFSTPMLLLQTYLMSAPRCHTGTIWLAAVVSMIHQWLVVPCLMEHVFVWSPIVQAHRMQAPRQECSEDMARCKLIAILLFAVAAAAVGASAAARGLFDLMVR